MSSLDAASVRALGALRSFRSKKKLLAGKQPETHILSKEEKEKLIEDYVKCESAVARKRVEHAETAINQEQEEMRNAEKVGLKTTKPEITLEEMLTAIGDSLSILASSHHGEDGEDEDDHIKDPELGGLSEDDQPGWVMHTISNTGQHRMECLRQTQMKLEEFTPPGWGDAANYFGERNDKYGMIELEVPVAVLPQTEHNATCSGPTTFGEPMEILDSVPGKLWVLPVTSHPGSSQMRRGSRKPRTREAILSLPPAPALDLSTI